MDIKFDIYGCTVENANVYIYTDEDKYKAKNAQILSFKKERKRIKTNQEKSDI